MSVLAYIVLIHVVLRSFSTQRSLWRFLPQSCLGAFDLEPKHSMCHVGSPWRPQNLLRKKPTLSPAAEVHRKDALLRCEGHPDRVLPFTLRIRARSDASEIQEENTTHKQTIIARNHIYCNATTRKMEAKLETHNQSLLVCLHA